MKNIYGVDDGTRTHDDRNHNPGLYQLSYTHQRYQAGTPGRNRTCNLRLRRPLLYPVELQAHGQYWSGQLDSNQRPSAPKADALPGCAIPRLSIKCAIHLIVGRKYSHRLQAAQEDFAPFGVVKASQFPSRTRIKATPAIAVGT